jgi:plastocyanin
MTHSNFRALSRSIVFFVLGFLTACGGGGADLPSADNSGEVSTLALSTPSSTLAVGTTVQLSAIPRDAAGNPVDGLPDPSFTSSDTSRATVDASGVVTGEAPGAVTISATLVANGETLTASTQLVITAPPPAGVNLVTTVGVTFSPTSITISQGDSIRWDFAGATHNVTFLGAAPAGGDIPDQQPGTTATRVFTAAGTFDYECTRHSGMAGTVVVQSGAAQVFTSLTLTPASPSINVGGTLQLTATARDQVGNVMTGLPGAQYSSSDLAVAAVSSSGMITGAGAGTATITASVTANSLTHSATAQVTVSAAPPSGTTVTTPNLTFAPATLTITAGTAVTWQFSGSTHNVTFLGASPAGGDIADQSPGTSVSRTFTTGGTYDYECTRHSGMLGSIVVQASGGSVFTAVTLTPANPQTTVGGTLQLTATPRDQVGNAMSGYPAAAFTTSDPVRATVSSSGVVTGVGAGSATITATISGSGITHSASVTITVAASQPAGATVTTPGNSFSPANVSIPVGGQVTWQISGSTHNVTFSGNAPTGGNIGDTQSGSSVSRTFSAPGTYAYQCTRHSGMSGSVTVQGGSGPPVFTGIRVTPQSGVVAIGSTLQLVAEPVDQFGAPMAGLGNPSFSSANTSRATVTTSGVVSGISAGTVTITASLSSQGITKSAQVSVLVASGNEPTVTTSADEFQPEDLDVAPGETVIFVFAVATHNVTFEEESPPGGNIGDTAPGNAVARTFTTPGDYDYECTIHKGMKGRIRVR